MSQRFIQDIDKLLESMATLSIDRNASTPKPSIEERVHAFRKFGKRVRANLDLFFPHRPKPIREFRKGIAEVARTLSLVRDQHVALHTAQGWLARESGSGADRETAKWLGAFVEAQSVALARDEEQMESLLGDACERVASARDAWAELASRAEPKSPRAGLLCSYRRGRRLADALAEDSRDAEHFHELRKMTKRFGYQADWLAEARGVALGATHELSKMLGDVLGEGLDLRRLGEQLMAWVYSDRPSDDHGLAIASRFLAEGDQRLAGALPIACQLYFQTGRSFRRALDRRLSRSGEG